MPDPRDPFANLDPSKLVALDGEEDRPKPRPAAQGEVTFAPPSEERVLELDLPPPRRGSTAPQPPPIPGARPTGPLPPRTTGPLPRTTGPLPAPPRTTGPLPRTEPRPSAQQLEEAAAAAVAAAAAAREAGTAAPIPPPAPISPATPAPSPPLPAPPATRATSLPDETPSGPSPRMAFAGGMVLALGLGFLPAHLYASFAERSYDTIRAEATHAEPAVNDAVYQAELDERETAISQLNRAKVRIAVVTAIVWLAVSGALGFAWLKLVQSRLPAGE
ncbi:MAG TPA: hypothetical protein VKE22_21300 [Haliangiales bacterium]|nr:hypothetical protein [Haliangiales bacterium]